MATDPIRADHGSVTNNRINMIARIDAACRTHRMPVSTFGRRAINDPRLVQDLIDGRSLRPATEARILLFIEKLEA